MKIKGTLTLIRCFVASMMFAQGSEVEMADGMRASGKIYVVVAVIVTILVGLIAYLAATDKKISKLEKEINANI